MICLVFDDLNNKAPAVSAEFETLITNQDLGHALRRFLGMRNQINES